MSTRATLHDWLEALEARGLQFKHQGSEWVGPCPTHGGKTKMWVKQGATAVLTGCHSGCTIQDLAKAVNPNGDGPRTMPPPDWPESPDADEEVEVLRAKFRKRYKEASHPGPDGHPYFSERGYDTPARARVDGKTLLIPMFGPGEEIMGLELRWWTGKSWMLRSAKGSRSRGAYCPIGHVGMAEETGRVLIAEGAATAAAVAKAVARTDMDGAVAIAFSAGNLTPVAENLHQAFPDAEIKICSDNDRFKSDRNPGVEFARKAAKAVGGHLCIPDFKDLSTKPTDFDDLYRLEGADAVRKWLDPDMAVKADIHRPGSKSEPSDPKPPKTPAKRKRLLYYDNELADLLTEEDLARWLHDPRRGWYVAPPGRWDWDRDDRAAQLRSLLRQRAEEAADENDMELRLRHSTVAGAVAMIDAAVQDKPAWDANSMIAGLPDGGVLDLKTGDSRPAERTEFVSRRFGVLPDPKAPPPNRFLDFVHDMVQDDATREWLIHFMAYALTGENMITDHITPLFCGEAGAGKDTLFGILSAIFDSYAYQLPQDVLIAGRGARERHPEWMVGLDGARLAFSTEVPANGKLRAGIFKDLAGGRQIQANRMRRDGIEFTPTAKIIFYGNHPPSLPGWDDGVKRRIVYVNCHAKTKAERIEGLQDLIIKEEAGAILHYLATTVATDWDRHCEGKKWLPEPSATSAAKSDDLFAANNPVGAAIEAVLDFTNTDFDFVASAEIRRKLISQLEAGGFKHRPNNNTVAAELRRLAADRRVKIRNDKRGDVRGWYGIAVSPS